MNVKSEFWQLFNDKSFVSAQEKFEQLSVQEKQDIFAELFQKSQYQRIPHSISVLFRELHPGKTFADFHQAWFPAQDTINAQQQFGQTFYQFFPAPIRVINAANMTNPQEIVSVGLHWLTEEQAAEMLTIVEDRRNKDRGVAIAKVADRTKAGVYKVKSDDNLGTAF
jgi:hypothetical protein